MARTMEIFYTNVNDIQEKASSAKQSISLLIAFWEGFRKPKLEVKVKVS